MYLLLQVKSGTIFDNVLITDDEEYASEFGQETWGETKDPEKSMKDKVGTVLIAKSPLTLLLGSRTANTWSDLTMYFICSLKAFSG